MRPLFAILLSANLMPSYSFAEGPDETLELIEGYASIQNYKILLLEKYDQQKKAAERELSVLVANYSTCLPSSMQDDLNVAVAAVAQVAGLQPQDIGRRFPEGGCSELLGDGDIDRLFSDGIFTPAARLSVKYEISRHQERIDAIDSLLVELQARIDTSLGLD